MTRRSTTASGPCFGTLLDAGAVKSAVLGPRFVDLVRALGGQPRGSGTSMRCPCFLHGGKGSNLVITPATGLWHCMSVCGGGDAITLVQRALGAEFDEALEWLASWARVRGEGGWTCAPSGSPLGGPYVPHYNRPAPVLGDVPMDEAGAFLASLWGILEDAPWSDRVADWLSVVRGVEPDAPFALGCRDWSTRRRDIAALLGATPTDELVAVGLAREGRLHWAVRGCLQGDPNLAAVAVPVWRWGRTFPERWRFRLVVPIRTRDGKEVKVLGPYGTVLPVDLLGCGRPDRLDAPEVRLAHLGADTEGSRLVLIVEGEPDFWSATEAVDGRAVVLGVCGSPKKWGDRWPLLADLTRLGVERVAVCVHKGAPNSSMGKRGHGEDFASSVAGETAKAGLRFTRKLAAEGADLNDLHRAGRLRHWLADVLEVGHGR